MRKAESARMVDLEGFIGYFGNDLESKFPAWVMWRINPGEL
jgi:hypothetical protein